MKNSLLLLTIALISLCSCSQDSVSECVTFARVDPLTKVFRESSFFPEYNQIQDYAAGESASFQFVVRSDRPLSNVQIDLTPLQSEEGKILNQVRPGVIEYVKVGRKTPDRASDASLPLSNYYPDPIIDTNAFDMGRDRTQPFWFTVDIPKDAAAGLYKGTVKVKGKMGRRSFTFSQDVELRVFPVVLPTPDLWVTNWFAEDENRMKWLQDGAPVERYSEQYWNYIRLYAKKMHRVYQNVTMISPLELTQFTEKDGVWSFDFSAFDRMASILREEGVMKMLEGGHIAGREGLWDSQFALNVPVKEGDKMVFKRFRVETPQARNFYDQFIPAFVQHLKEKNLADVYAQHIADEPTSFNIESYKAIARYLKKLAPDVKIIEACHSHDLEDVLDIWVPQLNFYKEGYDFYRSRQQLGEEVWFYTCLGPQGEMVNRFIEQPTIKTRLIHWVNYRYGATGYLHWGLNIWRDSDPFGDASGVITESGNVLPAGDCYIVYPGKGKLYGSIRLEAMRDGIADYTLLQMLEKKNPELARELCRQVVYNWAKYDTDGDHLRATRSQILTELSK